ncbi:uncharacterized protein K441DRAFT_176153 [Cenococcum geophilum 1.58]|uniref:uncharacterized protein n=1 Tax=Cenococcum geophilum 1.58 TaxID=794803 RepID=UPI0035901AFD|nr:hypothetical protein K441DRAFT_176153 [Cenococcum geophilum 1.58]
MADSELSWASAYWALLPLGVNTMLQPSGKVCGFHASLSSYLRSSPIVCVADATLIVIFRFPFYCMRDAPGVAAKKVLVARGAESTPSCWGSLQFLDNTPIPRSIGFCPAALGLLSQFIKLASVKGIDWTLTWACFYVVDFVVMEIMKFLAQLEEDTPELDKDTQSEKFLSIWERLWGSVAIILQLYATTYADLKKMKPDPILSRRIGFRFFRLAGHFNAVPIYIIGNEIGASKLSDNQARKVFLSTLAIFLILTGVEWTSPQYTQLYFLASLLSSTVAWLLRFSPRFRETVLGCEEERTEHWHWNVFAFDLFCRVFLLGTYWYVQHYDATGTFKPDWTSNLG